MIYRFNTLIVCFLLVMNIAWAQEETICDNGIDDDGDGFIDCYDSDCANKPSCEDFFLPTDPTCQVTPPSNPTFAMKLQWASPNASAAANGQVAVGDLDGDGIPEVVATNYYRKTVSVLDGVTGNEKYSLDLGGFSPYFECMIADVDEDGFAEIFIPGYDGQWKVRSYSYDLTTLNWEQTTTVRPGNIGIANFKYDPVDPSAIAKRPILYGKDVLIDARTGLLLHASAYNNTTSSADYADKNLVAGSTAADILEDSECANCDGLELINGGNIYSVSLGATSATLNLERTVNTTPVYISAWSQNRGGTSVVDFNEDGFLDVLFNGRTSGSSLTKVFFWDVENNNLVEYYDAVDNWDKGTGRLNIADIDGDGKLNTTYVSGPYLYALDENWTLKWKSSIIEGTSGTTGATVFDFNGDGSFETVYRDENFLYIVNGSNGSFYSSQACRSLTFMEYPVVADLDGDGATEICVTCITSNTGNIWDDSDEGQVRVFESDDEQWVPARRLWNQHGYFIVNINEDLTIPYQQQLHNQLFPPGTDPCANGIYYPRPLNTFLNQAPYVSYTGCQVFADTNLELLNIEVASNAVCPDTDFQINLTIQNNGSRGINTTIPVTFYNGNPEANPVTAIKLNTENITINLNPGEAAVSSNVTVQGPGSAFTLFVVINDNGLAPLPLNLTDASEVEECEYADNIEEINIDPDPFTISAVLVNDNESCGGAATSNGEVRAFVDVNGVETTAGYTFSWYDLDPADPAATLLFVGPIYSNVGAGTYFVIAEHNTALCDSEVASVTVNNSGAPAPVLDIEVTNAFSNCKNPNGKLTVTVNGGDPVGNFEYVWLDGLDVGISDTISISHVAASLENKTYLVIVTDKATGCTANLPATVPSDIEYPIVDATITNVSSCNTMNDGEIAASVVDGSGNVISGGHKFSWYIGSAVKPAPDQEDSGPGGVSTFSGLTAGFYTLVVQSNNTGCEVISTYTVTAPDPISALNTTTTDNTACDITAYNGTATLNSIQIGSTIFTDLSTFTLEWYAGQTTLGTVLSNAATMTDLAPGIYTIRAVQNGSDCEGTAEVTVLDTPPTITATGNKTDQTDCSPANGELFGNASGGAAPYDFLWYEGNIGTPDLTAPDFTASAASDGVESDRISGRPAGDYTLVVRDNLGCTADPIVVNIVDLTTGFAISATVVENSSCDATGNGSITADIAGATAGYSFQIIDGALNSISLTNTATNLVGGTYTIIATDTDGSDGGLGCTATEVVTIQNIPESYTVSATGTDNNFCFSFDGTATASVDVNGTPTTSGFEFYWFKDLGAGAPDYNNPFNADITVANIANLEPGVYTVYAQSTTTSCFMPPADVTIGSTTSTPAATITNTPQISCDLTNLMGSITVEVTDPASNFQIEIFTGPNTIITERIVTDFPGATPTTYNDLDAGLYTVKITNLTSECIYTEQTIILDGRGTLNLAASVSQQVVRCDAPFAGEITADVDGAVNGFNFYWFNGNFGSPALGSADAVTNDNGTYSNLSAGFYTVVAENNSTKCLSDPVVVEVVDSSVIPTLNLDATTDQSACSTTLSNGTITISLGGGEVFSDYVVELFAGQNTSTPVVPAPGFDPATGIFSGLEAGIYTAKITSNSTGCENTVEAEIQSDVNNPTITTLATNVMSCPGDGTITASVSVGNVAEYTFSWYTGSVVDAANLLPETSNVLSGLEAGEYTVIGVNNTLGCDAIPAVVTTVIDDPSKIITLTSTSDLIPSKCIDNNGEQRVNASSPGNTGGFDYEWFEGNVLTDSPPFTSVPHTGDGTGESRIVGVTSGIYSTIVTNNDTGCEETIVSFLPYAEGVDVITNANPDTDCANDNGSVDFTFTTSGVLFPITFYGLDLYKDNVLVFTINSIPSVNYSVPNLGEGDYTYVVKETDVSLNGCDADLGDFVIDLNVTYPVIDSSTKNENRTCAGGANDGEITITASGPAPFDYVWSDVNGNPVGGNSPSITGLSAGTYTVVVTGNNNCETTTQYEIFSTPTELVLRDFAIVNSTNCDPVNGSFETILIQDTEGNDYDEDLDFDYAYFLYDKGSNTKTPLGLPNNRIASNLAPNSSTTEYIVEITYTSRQCVLEKSFTIEDEAVLPIATGTITANSNCDTDPDGDTFHVGTGSVQLVIDGNGDTDPNNFIITWFEDTGMTIPLGTNYGSIGGVNGSLASGLPTGTVTALIRDNHDATGNAGPDLGCETTSTFTIPEVTPAITLTLAQTEDTNCAAPFTGSITVTEVLEDGVAVDITQYEFNWSDENGTDYTGNVTPSLTALEGDIQYAVQAIKITDGTEPGAIGCTSTTVEVDIIKNTADPVIEISSLDDNTNCGVDGNGQITILIDGAALDLAEHTVIWRDNTNAIIATDTDQITELVAGSYSVEVSDILAPNLSCVATASFNIINNPPAYSLVPNPTPNEDCTPENGAVNITEILVGGIADLNLGNYTFNYYDEFDNVYQLDGGPTKSDFPSGIYFVEAIQDNIAVPAPPAADPNTYCSTGKIRFEIKSNTSDPVVTSTIVNNTNCAGSTANGQITIDIDMGADPLDYTIVWEKTAPAAFPLPPANITNNGLEVVDLDAGTYQVTITDNTTPGAGCITVTEFIILDTPPVIGVSNFDLTPNTICNAATATDGNGTVEITEITVNGVPANLADFSFTWFLSLSPNTIIPGSGNGPTPGVTLRDGEYYVTATQTASSCSSTPAVRFIIEDDTQEPVIDLTSFSNPEMCSGPNVTGSISVIVDNTIDLVNYEYNWYRGTSIADPLISTATPVLDGPTIVAGFYTFEAINLNTNCSTVEVFELVDNIVIPRILPSSSPVTNCVTDDGIITVDIVGSTANYTYEWYRLPNVSSPYSLDKTVQNVGIGTYRVIATNADEPGCVTLTADVEVEEMHPQIDVVITPDMLVTNCDDTRPNGQLSATANGKTAGFEFEWFVGASTTGTPFKTGPVADFLSAGETYSVLVTDLVSGCEVNTSVVMGEATIPAKSPDIEILAQQISCTPDKTGALRASVDGSTSGYEFFWYFGANGSGSPINDQTIHFIDSLDVGVYSVVVTDLRTGCISEPVSAEIVDETIIPEFLFTVTAATCDQPNGGVSIIAEPGFSILRAEWEINGSIFQGFNVGGLEAGIYTVTVYGPGECPSTAEVEVPAEIVIYNGFSPNGDGRNEWFLIECLEFFPDNTVKVYNRAGQLVYMASGYDNENVKFDGKGNRGIYAGENNVPDGTYFYIVDKNDGSPVQKGYLEISR